MALPPVSVGASQLTSTLALPGVRSPRVGAPGTVRGVPVEGLDAAVVPKEFVAVSVTEYSVPLSRVEKVQVSRDVVQVVTSVPPALKVAVYDVIDEPVLLGADHVTVRELSPGTTVEIDGTLGNVSGVPFTDVLESDVPTALVAVTVTP